MTQLTLLRQGHSLSDPQTQLQLLADQAAGISFSRKVAEHGVELLQPTGLQVLQANVGKVCNQTCEHCHVDAGPERRESMSVDVAQACLNLLQRARIPVLDITGGAPEMNPQFRMLVSGARQRRARVIDRCNLTILTAPGFTDLPEFLAEHEVEIIASLPCYLEQNVDQQRGAGVFERSLQALRKLNSLGYGVPGSPLVLTLVYNPLGPGLPPPQAKLEADYRRELRARYGIEFSRLFTITNMPISRFLASLAAQGRVAEYLSRLVGAFNPATLAGLMCRTMLSVDWRGALYDCDFNQMLELPVAGPRSLNVLTLTDADLVQLQQRAIRTDLHCFGCTAGAGSSCGGVLTE